MPKSKSIHTPSRKSDAIPEGKPEKQKAPDEDELLNAQVAANLEQHRSYMEDPDMIDKNKYSELGKRAKKKKKKKKKAVPTEPPMTPEKVISEQNQKFG